MPILVAFAYYLGISYQQALKRNIGKKDISKLTIVAISTLFGHPLIFLYLLMRDQFALPSQPEFYWAWLALVSFSFIKGFLLLYGLINTQFLGALSIAKIKLIFTAILAMAFLGERLSPSQSVAALLACFGVMMLIKSNEKLKWDKGALAMLIAMALGAFGNIFYKIAALHTTTFSELLSGRLVMDLVYWGIFWIIGMLAVLKQNPANAFLKYIKDPEGRSFIIIHNILSFVHAWLIFNLPVTIIALIGLITVPASYMIGKYKYREYYSKRLVFSSAMIVGALAVFTLF